MIYLLTSGQTSVKKFSKQIFLPQKIRRQIVGVVLGVILIFDFIFWSGSSKNTLLSFKRQKRTQLLNVRKSI